MCVLVYLSSSSSVADKSFIRSTFCQLSAMSFFGWRWWCFSWMHLNTKTPSLRLYLVGRVYLLSYLCRETMSMMKRKKYIRAEKWAWQQIISNFGKIKRCTTMTPHKPWIISGFIQQQSFLLVKYGAWWPACSFILSPFPLFSPSTSPWMRKYFGNACIKSNVIWHLQWIELRIICSGFVSLSFHINSNMGYESELFNELQPLKPAQQSSTMEFVHFRNG